MAITHTTNIHAAAPDKGRVRLSASIEGNKGRIVWIEVFDADGCLRACGPCSKQAPAWAQDRISQHGQQMFEGSMYWRAN